MFPDAFVDSSKEGYEFIVMAKFIKKMKKRAGKNNTDNTKIHHVYILTQKSKLFIARFLKW